MSFNRQLADWFRPETAIAEGAVRVVSPSPVESEWWLPPVYLDGTTVTSISVGVGMDYETLDEAIASVKNRMFYSATSETGLISSLVIEFILSSGESFTVTPHYFTSGYWLFRSSDAAVPASLEIQMVGSFCQGLQSQGSNTVVQFRSLNITCQAGYVGNALTANYSGSIAIYGCNVTPGVANVTCVSASYHATVAVFNNFTDVGGGNSILTATGTGRAIAASYYSFVLGGSGTNLTADGAVIDIIWMSHLLWRCTGSDGVITTTSTSHAVEATQFSFVQLEQGNGFTLTIDTAAGTPTKQGILSLAGGSTAIMGGQSNQAPTWGTNILRWDVHTPADVLRNSGGTLWTTPPTTSLEAPVAYANAYSNTELGDATDQVNTSATFKITGRQVYAYDSRQALFASGTNPTDPWVDISGTTVITPA